VGKSHCLRYHRLGSDLTFRSDTFVRLIRAFQMILELAVSFRQLLSDLVGARRRITIVPSVTFKSHCLADLEFMHDATPLHDYTTGVSTTELSATDA
jgi:hypothetical protein